MNIAFRPLTLLAFLIFPYCAESIAQTAQPKSIAIISDIGHRIAERTTGLTVFSNSKKTLEVDDWNLDQLITEQVATFLVSKGYNLASVHYDWHDFETPDMGFSSDEMPSKVLKRTHEASPPNGTDIYLVISRAAVVSQTPLGQFDGLGVATASVFGHSAGAVQAGFVITLVDARTFKTIDSTVGQIPTDSLFGRGPPVKTIDVSGWPDSYEALSPDQWVKIHNELQSLVFDAVSFSLPRVKFPS